MKIEDNRELVKYTFGYVEIGDVFMIGNSSRIFMKIPQYIDCSGIKSNCICLNDGVLHCLSGGEDVEVLDATVVIE